MVIKTVEQMKDERAILLAQAWDRSFTSWKEMIETDFEHGIGLSRVYSREELMRDVAELYAQQFKDRITELEDKLKECKVVLENREHMSSKMMQAVADTIESLINKSKHNGKRT